MQYWQPISATEANVNVLSTNTLGANNILYSLVVLKENWEEREIVAPAVWVKDNKVFYPNGLQVNKLHKSCTAPKDDWPQYELMKVKCTVRFTSFNVHVHP